MLNDPLKLMAQETRLREGRVPEGIGSDVVKENQWRITPQSFLMRAQDLVSFYYEHGEGVIFERREGVPDATVDLFYRGSVYGAIAWLNGLVPLHASAVVDRGSVVAFTGDSGAGKSTLVAGLASVATPLFADDVLIVDLRGDSAVTCLPGHKMLKLWGDAFELTSLARGERVYPGIEKFYASSPYCSPEGLLPLRLLSFLEEGDQSITSMTGAERFNGVSDALYRPEYAIGAGLDFNDLFALRSKLANRLQMFRLSRPRAPGAYSQTTKFVRDALLTLSGGNRTN